MNQLQDNFLFLQLLPAAVKLAILNKKLSEQELRGPDLQL